MAKIHIYMETDRTFKIIIFSSWSTTIRVEMGTAIIRITLPSRSGARTELGSIDTIFCKLFENIKENTLNAHC